jgi:hypothetical protein
MAERVDEPPVRLRRDHHNALVLRSRGRHWIECSCGWLSRVYGLQVDAVVEHAEHVHHAKETTNAE